MLWTETNTDVRSDVEKNHETHLVQSPVCRTQSLPMIGSRQTLELISNTGSSSATMTNSTALPMIISMAGSIRRTIVSS